MYCFQNILGNEFIINNLRKSVENNTLSHTYLFWGNKGVGRKTIVNTLVKYMLCDNRINGTNETLEPCNNCKSCITFENNNHTDIVYIGEVNINEEPEAVLDVNIKKPRKSKKDEKAEKEKKTKSIGIDEIREKILNVINYKPFYSFKKIYIINNADKLTVEAQNTLLKTLEEPPEHVMFFLIAEKKENLITTVLSRVVEVNIPPIREQLVKNYILEYKKTLSLDDEKRNLDEDFISAYAQGSIGLGIELIKDEEFFGIRENITNDLYDLSSMTLSQTMLLAEKWDKEYKKEARFFDILEIWFRDLSVVSETDDDSRIIQKDKKDKILELVYSKSNYDFKSMYKYVIDAKKSIINNGNFRLTIDVMLIYIKEKEFND